MGTYIKRPRFTAFLPNLGIQILATLNGFEVAAKLAHKITIAMTAVYTPSQAYLGAEANVKYIIPYVKRLFIHLLLATRFLDNVCTALEEPESVIL